MPEITPPLAALLLFTTSFSAGAWAVLRRREQDGAHLFLAFATGVFIATLGMELLPAAFTAGEPFPSVALIIAGFVGFYVIEKFIDRFTQENQKRNDQKAGSGWDSHMTVALTTLAGLCVHSLAEGAALGVGLDLGTFGSELVFSVAVHHVVAAFAVGALFVLAKTTPSLSLGAITLFALAPPAGIALGQTMVDSGRHENGLLGLLTALTAGAFLYIATADLIPETFHGRSGPLMKVALVSAGAGLIVVSSLMSAH